MRAQEIFNCARARFAGRSSSRSILSCTWISDVSGPRAAPNSPLDSHAKLWPNESLSKAANVLMHGRAHDKKGKFAVRKSNQEIFFQL
jgi:hypothetical protein